ncbi:hypothetical protein [Nocardiopsis sp. NRRL B-16309]|uniref:hypothetical protein n=1 Tax=Nocardiopsis sp. NRRL B-16309 TaxID=1519494 RepID=UPI0006AEBC1F|nr:hypothetical protein [Nocardiopsis sp. NRRL B-16309]KOX11832.1 hypothetical protein ADL05_23000 [Nocardiopsis sp. NRRL B-16309]
MSTPEERGREVVDWMVRLVHSKTLTADEVAAQMDHTEDLALLVARFTVGSEARLCRARQRAVLGLPGHESAPPSLAEELAEAMSHHTPGTPLAPELVQALAEVRDQWSSAGASACEEPYTAERRRVSIDDIIVGLRTWTHNHDPHVRAAVELLITHDDGMWLRRREFVETFVKTSGPEFYIAFSALADALAAGEGPGASETETGILRLAADLANDRWRISRMGDETVHLVRVAIATATE